MFVSCIARSMGQFYARAFWKGLRSREMIKEMGEGRKEDCVDLGKASDKGKEGQGRHYFARCQMASLSTGGIKEVLICT